MVLELEAEASAAAAFSILELNDGLASLNFNGFTGKVKVYTIGESVPALAIALPQAQDEKMSAAATKSKSVANSQVTKSEDMAKSMPVTRSKASKMEAVAVIQARADTPAAKSISRAGQMETPISRDEMETFIQSPGITSPFKAKEKSQAYNVYDSDTDNDLDDEFQGTQQG
jgi:hypothetical protein